MDALNERDMTTHVSILGWIYVISHALFLAMGAFAFALLIGIGVVARDGQAMTVMGLVGIFVGGLMVLLALPGLLAGYGLLRRRSWGRILAIIVAILNLANFPLGTVLGLYALYVLMQTSAGAYFATERLSA